MGRLEENAKFLKLPFMREFGADEAIRAEAATPGYYNFLDELIQKEVEARKERSIQNKIRNARFPRQMSFDDFKLEHYSLDLQKNIKNLSSLKFIDNRENVILVGNPGVGKTALALSLGLKACLNQKTVLFLNVSDLIISLRESMSQNQITTYRRKFSNYDLVILDELGFVSFDKESSEILFNLLSNRNEKGSMIITSNLTVNKWNEVFHDPLLTTALVDRLAYKSHLLDMTGDSFRVMETQKWQKDRDLL